jgi:glycosyltransferase involved in cell wall biosynthesis
MTKIYKVLHITPTDVSYDSRILKELTALERLENCEFKAFGIDDDEGHRYEVTPLPYVRTFKLFTKKMGLLPRPIRYILNLIEAFCRLTIPAIRYQPSIIHCHDTLYLPIALFTKFFCGSKLIYDAHELESDKAGQSRALAKGTLFIEKLGWNNIDLLISVSPSILKWYTDNLGAKPNLLILNSPVVRDNASKDESCNYLREKFNIPSNRKIFLYLGIISIEGRFIDKYLEVFQKPDVSSHIVFVGYGEYVEKVKEFASKYPNIHYHPAVAHQDVVEISRSADVGMCMIEAVSLSDYYCLPNKLFEYAFSNLFVLASDFPDIRAIVNQYGLGKCSGLTLEEIYIAVKELETVEIELKVDNLYTLSWNYQADQLLKEYKKLLN